VSYTEQVYDEQEDTIMCTMTTTTDRLETKTCSRCGGSGHYSYCQMYGTICFLCKGKKEILTKRGAAASDFLHKLRSKPAADLVAGEKVQYSGITMAGATFHAWGVVESIVANEDGTLKIHVEDKKYGGCLYSNANPAELWRVAQTKEQVAETFRQAMEYQATLTQTGTVRKVAVNPEREAARQAKVEAAKVAKAAAKQAEYEARQAEVAANAAKWAAEQVERDRVQAECEAQIAVANAWLIDVLVSNTRSGFCQSVVRDLRKKSLSSFSDRCLSICQDIYAKSFGRSGSKAYDAASNEFQAKLDSCNA
jgi:hypothetical protein